MLRCPIDNFPCTSSGCSFRGGYNEQCHRKNIGELQLTTMSNKETEEMEAYQNLINRITMSNKETKERELRLMASTWNDAIDAALLKLDELFAFGSVDFEIHEWKEITKTLENLKHKQPEEIEREYGNYSQLLDTCKFLEEEVSKHKIIIRDRNNELNRSAQQLKEYKEKLINSLESEVLYSKYHLVNLINQTDIK